MSKVGYSRHGGDLDGGGGGGGLTGWGYYYNGDNIPVSPCG